LYVFRFEAGIVERGKPDKGLKQNEWTEGKRRVVKIIIICSEVKWGGVREG
jgi:hypothetical protein